jgi:predicted DNA-binding protein
MELLKTKNITVRLPRETTDKIKQACAQEETTVSYLIRWLVENWLREHSRYRNKA